jgi:hypothetical protein
LRVDADKKKTNNYFKKGRDVSVSLVTLPCKQYKKRIGKNGGKVTNHTKKKSFQPFQA